MIRNLDSIRPYQHVLEPLSAYLLIAAKQYDDKEYASFYNVGPDGEDCLSTGQIADLFIHYWGNGARWIKQNNEGSFESNYLKLDCSKIKSLLGWKPKWRTNLAVKKTTDWYKMWYRNDNTENLVKSQINEYFYDSIN